MFENLTNKLGNVFNSLKKRGALTEKDVDEALRDVRVALLEADVSLEVVKDFIIKVRERAVGQEVLKSVTPGQQVVKIVNDVLIDALGTANSPLEINHSPPVVMLLVGLQGSGKTTTAGKLALHLKNKEKKKVMLASLDIYRPAAREQLRLLGEQAEVLVLPAVSKINTSTPCTFEEARALLVILSGLSPSLSGKTRTSACSPNNLNCSRAAGL